MTKYYRFVDLSIDFLIPQMTNEVTSTYIALNSFGGFVRYIRNVLTATYAVLFLVFAALQINDATQYGNHDAWIWIGIYVVMSAICALLFLRKRTGDVVPAWVGFTWGCWLFKIQDEHGNLHFDWLVLNNYWTPDSAQMVQRVNESGGLFILACCALSLLFLRRL